jgi:hypothetical protein
MENLNLFEAVQILAKNGNMKAVKPNGCKIVWRDKVIDGSKYHAPDTEFRQLVFVNLTGYENENILTDLMIAQQNENFWSIVLDEK